MRPVKYEKTSIFTGSKLYAIKFFVLVALAIGSMTVSNSATADEGSPISFEEAKKQIFSLIQNGFSGHYFGCRIEVEYSDNIIRVNYTDNNRWNGQLTIGRPDNNGAYPVMKRVSGSFIYYGNLGLGPLQVVLLQNGAVGINIPQKGYSGLSCMSGPNQIIQEER